jgi:hypothetical protein
MSERRLAAEVVVPAHFLGVSEISENVPEPLHDSAPLLHPMQRHHGVENALVRA